MLLAQVLSYSRLLDQSPLGIPRNQSAGFVLSLPQTPELSASLGRLEATAFQNKECTVRGKV